MVRVFVLLAASLLGAAHADRIEYQWAGKGSAPAVNQLIQRVLQGNKTQVDAIFELSIDPGLCSQQAALGTLSDLCFSLSPPDSSASKVKIIGTSGFFFVNPSNACFRTRTLSHSLTHKTGVDLAAGVGHYLRTRCNMSISWARAGGHQVAKASQLHRFPKVTAQQQESKRRHTDISYFANVVTFSYTLPWHDFSDWEKLIDWMALEGVNLALAYSGQEEVLFPFRFPPPQMLAVSQRLP